MRQESTPLLGRRGRHQSRIRFSRMVRVVLAWVIVALMLASSSIARAQPPSEESQPDLGSFPARIDAIRITGLARTKEFVVRREIGFREGDVITKADFELALARLWNMTIFARVGGRVAREGTR